MTDISAYHKKTDKQFLFNVKSDWKIYSNEAVFYSDDVKPMMEVGLNNKLGGATQEWTPEHIFLSAIGSSFMTTFMLVCQESKCHINHFECNTIGQVKFIDDACQFTQVDVFAKIEIEDEELKHIINENLEKTKKHCLIAHSVRSRVIYHPEVVVTTSTKKCKNNDNKVCNNCCKKIKPDEHL